MREQTTWSGFRTNRSLALFIHFENCLFFARIFWVAPDAFHTHTHAPLAHNSKERKLFIDTWNHKSRQCSACESRDARGRRSTSWVTDNVCAVCELARHNRSHQNRCGSLATCLKIPTMRTKWKNAARRISAVVRYKTACHIVWMTCEWIPVFITIARSDKILWLRRTPEYGHVRCTLKIKRAQMNQMWFLGA